MNQGSKNQSSQNYVSYDEIISQNDTIKGEQRKAIETAISSGQYKKKSQFQKNCCGAMDFSYYDHLDKEIMMSVYGLTEDQMVKRNQHLLDKLASSKEFKQHVKKQFTSHHSKRNEKMTNVDKIRNNYSFFAEGKKLNVYNTPPGGYIKKNFLFSFDLTDEIADFAMRDKPNKLPNYLYSIDDFGSGFKEEIAEATLSAIKDIETNQIMQVKANMHQKKLAESKNVGTLTQLGILGAVAAAGGIRK